MENEHYVYVYLTLRLSFNEMFLLVKKKTNINIYHLKYSYFNIVVLKLSTSATLQPPLNKINTFNPMFSLCILTMI